MQTTLSEDPQALNRHRAVILECVKDSDDSIRRKALDLVMVVSNRANAKDIVAELIDELRVCDRSFKKELSEKICVLIQKARMDMGADGPTTRWYIDTMLVVLGLAGSVTEVRVVFGDRASEATSEGGDFGEPREASFFGRDFWPTG